jgi:hypothetical protein
LIPERYDDGGLSGASLDRPALQKLLADVREHRLERLRNERARSSAHIRFLAPLAFLSPRIVQAIADGSAPRDLTVMLLARALPHSLG